MNPYIQYRHCNFCNEMFFPGEKVSCSANCGEKKKGDKGDSHYFHVVCCEILIENYKKETKLLQEIEAKSS